MSEPESVMTQIMKDYIDDQIKKSEHLLCVKIEKLEKLMDTKIDLQVRAMKEATIIAREAMNVRLDGMNEFRASLRDQSTTMYSRAEHDIYAEKIESDLDELKESMHRNQGKADQSAVNIALAISLVGTLIGLISLFITLFRG